VHEDLVLSKILTRAAFENGVRTLAAIGGSTNAVIHLLAIAGRLGVPLTLADFDALSRGVHCVANLMPSGKFLMEDLHYAGGMRAVLDRLRSLLNLDCLTVTGRSLGAELEGAVVCNDEVIASVTAPMMTRAPRQETLAASAARGALPTSAPSTPTVAVSADIIPNCERGNQFAAILSAPVKVTAAPRPTSRRPAKRTAGLGASPMASEPSPMTAPPPAITHRGPTLSSSTPPGTMKPA